MSSLKEIEERQKRMYKLIDQMTAEEDLNRMLQTVQLLEQEAKELEAAAMAFQDKMTKQYPKPPKGAFEVVLTGDQRQRILKATGVAMTTVLVDDKSGSMNSAMPSTQPAVIEAIALRQANEKKVREEAEIAARAALERQLRELEEVNELVAEQVAIKKRDPVFRQQMGLDPKK